MLSLAADACFNQTGICVAGYEKIFQDQSALTCGEEILTVQKFNSGVF